jgi:hypothetical protein
MEEESGMGTFEGMTMKSLKLITDALPPPEGAALADLPGGAALADLPGGAALADLPGGAALAGLAEDADASF